MNHKTVFLYDDLSQLTAVEQYIDESLYRIYSKTWDRKGKSSVLIAESIKDGKHRMLYHKIYSYDEKGNLKTEKEYGNLTGTHSDFIVLDNNHVPAVDQAFHLTSYSYKEKKAQDIVIKTDRKGNGIRFAYKKGSKQLFAKLILEEWDIKKRYFFLYDEDGVLMHQIVDDGSNCEEHLLDNVTERHLTIISPKQSLPNYGSPETIEEKCFDFKESKEILLSKRIFHFDDRGRIIRQDRYGADENFCYSLQTEYDDRDRVIYETDPMGNEIKYAYDSSDNLVYEWHSSDRIEYRNVYDLNHHLLIASATDENGTRFQTSFSYDIKGNKISSIDLFGNETRYDYDSLGRLTSILFPEVVDEHRNSLRPVECYEYDLFDRPISITDPRGNVTKKSYTVRGQPVSIRYPNGKEERFEYDLDGKLKQHYLGNNAKKEFKYDFLGRITHIEYHEQTKDEIAWTNRGNQRFEHNSFHLISETNEMHEKKKYKYNSAGSLSSIVRGKEKTEYQYDALGRLSTIKQWNDASSFTLHRKEYDWLDHVIKERIENQDGILILKKKNVFDLAGRLVQTVGWPQNQKSVLHRFEYDAFGRLKKTTDAYGNTTHFSYEEVINELGQKVLKRIETDPLGMRTEEICDALGRTVHVSKVDRTGKLLFETETFYDSVSNLIALKVPALADENILNIQKIQFSYNPVNQPQTIAYDGSNKQKETCEYNVLGELVSYYKPGSNQQITCSYTQKGQLHTLSSEEDPTVACNFSYDLKGNLIEEKNQSTTITRKFDINNRIIKETIRDRWGSYSLYFTYDGQGQIESIQLPDSSWIQYTYDGPLVKSISRQSNTKKERYVHRIDRRDLMGNPLNETLIGLAGSRKHSWDVAGRLTAITTDFFEEGIPKDGYDPSGNILKKQTSIQEEKIESVYSYDPLSQLISESGNMDHSYKYDSINNRLQKDHFSYKVNNLNQFIETDGISYVYDENGNLSSKTIRGKSCFFKWNALGRLIEIEDFVQNVSSFTYDIEGRCLSKTMKTNKKEKVFRYFYIGHTEIGAIDENGKLLELKVLVDPNQPETSPAAAIEIKKEYFAPIYDLHGNIVCLIDPKQRKIAESYRYSAFGEEQISNENGEWLSYSSLGNPWRFRAKRVEQEIGMAYFGQRFYDPVIGRWISPDPAGLIDGVNRYAFTHNNPLTYTDYFGLATEENWTERDHFFDCKYCYCECEDETGMFPHCPLDNPCNYCLSDENCSELRQFAHEWTEFQKRKRIQFAISDVVAGPFLKCITHTLQLSNRSDNRPIPGHSYDIIGFGFIGGINTSLFKSTEHAAMLSKYAHNMQIDHVYNATHSPPVDLMECILGYRGISTRPVSLLKQNWESFFNSRRPEAVYFQICYSQGAIHVRNALLSCSPEMRNRIAVLAIAPGAIIPRSLCRRSFNYVSKRDIVPYCDIIGNLFYRNELVTLEPHPDAPLFDHGFDSPTFQEIIAKRIDRFLQKYGIEK